MNFSIHRSALSVVVFVALVFFGGAHPAWVLPLMVVAGLLLMLNGFKEASALPRWLIAGWGILVAWTVLQTSFPLSLTPQESLWGLLNAGLYAAIFALAWRLGGDDKGAKFLLWALATIPLLLALDGLLLYATGTRAVLWLPKRYYLNDLTSTLINRNTYATLAGLGVLASLAMLLQRVGEIPSARRADWRQRCKAVMVLIAKPRWPWAIGALVIAVSLLLSHSRAGLAAAVFGIGLFGLALLYGARGARPFLLGLSGLGVLVVLLVGSTLGQGTLDRMAQAGADAAARRSIYATTWEATQAQPFTGTGLGSFEAVFRQQRTFDLPADVNQRIDHAHNSWLELALELGWPAFALMVMLALGLAWMFLRGLHIRKSGVIYPALGLAGLGLSSTHALVDFSPHIPGFSVYLAALVGLCAVQSVPTVRQQVAGRLTRWVLPVVGLALALPAAYLVYPTALAWQAEGPLNNARRGQQVPVSQLLKARQQFQIATRWWAYAGWQRDLALIDLLIANRLPAIPAAILRNDARQHLKQALSHQPLDPYSWHRLAVLELADKSKAAESLYQSLLMGPAEPNLVWERLPLILLLWEDLTRYDAYLGQEQLRLAWTQPYRAWRTVKYLPQGPERLAAALALQPGIATDWQKYTGRKW